LFRLASDHGIARCADRRLPCLDDEATHHVAPLFPRALIDERTDAVSGMTGQTFHIDAGHHAID
jgi:hypothetical protein